jgi:hypothetical protein
MGYIFVDLYICTREIQYTWSEGIEIYLHHIVGNTGGLISIANGFFWPNMAITVMVAELSTPILNLRWRLLKHKMTESKLFMISNVSFATVFFLSRCIFLPKLTVLVSQLFFNFDFKHLHPITYTGFFFSYSCLLILQLLQFYWMFLIANTLYKSLTGKHKKVESK